jgi:hypothetical protein
MNAYRFRNLNIKHEGLDFLVNGIAYFEIEDYEEDGKQAGFERAELYDALGKDGYVTSKEVLGYMSDTVLIALNNDSYLCRVLGNKIV